MSNNDKGFDLENIGTNVVHSDYMQQLKRQQMYNIPNLASVTMPNCDRIQPSENGTQPQTISGRSVISLSVTEVQSVSCGERIIFDQSSVYGAGGLTSLSNGDIEICRSGLCDVWFRVRSNPGSGSVGVFLDGEEIDGGRFTAGFFETAVSGRLIISLEEGRHILSLRNISEGTLRLSSAKCNDLSAVLIADIE